MKALVLGMGNTLLSDDGIGIIIKRYLEEKLNTLSYNGANEIDFDETSWGGFRIIDILTGYDYAIVVDSIKTANKPQGYIHHLKSNDLLPTLRLTSYHDINFATALKLAETLNAKIPADIDIFAVEVENNYTISEQISPDLLQSVKNCSVLIINQLAKHHLIPNDKKYRELPDTINAEELCKIFTEEFSGIN